MKTPKGKQRELIEAGTYNAVLVQIIDKGTQPSANPKFKPSRRVLLGFEVIGEKTEEGDPFILFKDYNFTDNPKSSLMKDAKAWLQFKDPDEFDWDEALGRPALLTIVHTQSADKSATYANINNISALPKGLKIGKGSLPLRTLYLDVESFDPETFNELSEGLRTKIAGSPEYADVQAALLKKKNGKGAPAAKEAKKKK